LCGVASMAIWSLAPSLGPASLITLAPGVEQRLTRVLNADYTRQMDALLRAGPRIVDANHLLGLISFPSMHTVMAAMAVAYSRRTFAFWPLVVLNTLMVPAILIHGEHHLIDIFGGLALFAIAWAWVGVLVPSEATLLPALRSTPLRAAGSSG
jgi:membrane-associated phospholipid phosphatase